MDKFSGLFDIIRTELSTYMEQSMRELLQKNGHQDASSSEAPVKESSTEEKNPVVQIAMDLMNAELFECESMMEFVVAPGEEFTKDWCFSNTGSYAFPAGPAGVELKLTEGDHQIVQTIDNI